MTKAWWSDPSTAQEVMAVFNRFTHYWFLPTGKREAIALCTGFLHRGAIKLHDPAPTCPGCQRDLKGKP